MKRLIRLVYIPYHSIDLTKAKAGDPPPVKVMASLLLTVLLCVSAKAGNGAVAPHWSARGVAYLQAAAERYVLAEGYELKPDQPVEREIKKGQAHFYQVKLSAGQYLHLTVEQKNIDVSLYLLNPAGEVISGVNWELPDASEFLVSRGIFRSMSSFTISNCPRFAAQ